MLTIYMGFPGGAGAAAAAKSLQSCLTLCDPIDGSPPGSAIPGVPQARTLEWVQVALVLKNQPTNSEDVRDQVRPLCQEDPLEEEMATPPIFLPGETHGQRSLAGYSPWDPRVRYD